MDEIEAKDEILRLLIGHYGKVKTWKTEHFDHFMVLIDLLGMEGSRQLTYKAARGQQFIDSLIGEQTKLLKMLDAVLASNMSVYDKGDIFDYISSQIPRLSDEQIDVSLESIFKNKEVGRPKKLDSIDEWIIYLTGKLGTNRKACNYVANHPILKAKSLETLIRTNRKYRADKDKRLY